MSHSSPPSSPTPQRFGPFTLLVVVLALSITLLAMAEVWVRATKPAVDLWVLTGRAKTMSWMQSWAQVDAFSAYRARAGRYVHADKTVNRYGFISTPELPVQRDDPNTLRIAFFGGSSTAGTGGARGGNLADADTWPWRVVERLRPQLGDRKIEFINAGLSGFTSFESYGRLWSRVRFFQPDIIVIDHGWNEMYYFTKGDEIVNWRTRPDGSWGFDETRSRKLIEPLWIDDWIRSSQLLTRVRLRLSPQIAGETAPSQSLSDHFNPTGPEIFRSNLRLIRSAAAQINAELFVIKQPTLVVADLPEAQRAWCRYDFHGFDHGAHVAAFAAIYSVIDDEIPAERIIDLTGLSGDIKSFFDHVHPTLTGVEHITTQVSSRLAEYLESSNR